MRYRKNSVRYRKNRWSFLGALAFAFVGGACGGEEQKSGTSTENSALSPLKSKVPLPIANIIREGKSEVVEESGCLSFAEGAWSISQTGFNVAGEALNAACVLVPSFDAEDESMHWVAGPGFSVVWATPADQKGSVPHSFSAAQDVIVDGRFPIEIFPRDLEAESTARLWMGTLEVSGAALGLAEGIINAKLFIDEDDNDDEEDERTVAKKDPAPEKKPDPETKDPETKDPAPEKKPDPEAKDPETKDPAPEKKPDPETNDPQPVNPLAAKAALRIANLKAIGSSELLKYSGCLGFSGGTWQIAKTAFSAAGEALNAACVLTPTFVLEDEETYWVAGPGFTVVIESADEDKKVAHSVVVADEVIVDGSFPIAIYPRNLETIPSARLWTGTLQVSGSTTAVSTGAVSAKLVASESN